MSTPTLEQELTAADSIEAVWCVWINSLRPWERTFVFANELAFHDLFCSGEWGWKDLDAVLKERFAA